MDNSNIEPIVQDPEEIGYKEQLGDSVERVEQMDMEEDDDNNNNNNVSEAVVVSKDEKLRTDVKEEDDQINRSCESADFDNPDLELTKDDNPIEKNGLKEIGDVKLDADSNGGVCVNSPSHDTPPIETNVKDETSVDTPKDEDDDSDTDTDTDTCSDSEFQDQDRTKENKHSDELVTIRNEQVSTPPKLDVDAGEGDVTGTPEEQALFMKELGVFHKERGLDFRPPKFYGEGLNLLKLYRSVIRLGGYETVTSCKLWRQVGESFNPPKTCTTVSWTFRCFYEKVLVEYEKHEMHGGELSLHDAYLTAPRSSANQSGVSQGSGRARRDAAARAMQGWHSQRLLSNGGVGDPSIKERNLVSTPKREKQLKSIGLLKRKIPPSPVEHAKVARMTIKPQGDMMVVDAGAPADWVKINVRKTKDCFEVYALVPGLLREEVRVQSDPVGRLVISGEPEQLDNHWGVTAFKKVVSLPSRIDPHQTSAVVTLHGQLFIRVPFEQSDL